jgi:hypothetical protein
MWPIQFSAMTDGPNDETPGANGGFGFPMPSSPHTPTPTPSDATAPLPPTGFSPMSPLPPGAGLPPNGVPSFSASPPTPKSNTKRNVLVAVFLVFLLLLGGCGSLIFLGAKAVKGATDEGNRFLTALYKNPADAAARVCKGTGLDVAALTEARSFLSTNGWDGAKSLKSSNVNSSNGKTTGEVGGSVHLADGDRGVRLAMEKHGSWCVSGFHVDGPTDPSATTEPSSGSGLK